MSGPDFVCIGAQKAGTTWLYDNLLHHPQVWMPPVKEIHFFSAIAPHRELLGLEGDKHPRNPFKRYASFWQRPTLARACWLRHFFRDDKTVGWYERIYRDTPSGRIAGDITPAYSTLDERGVEFARKVLKPGCKVFVILRNPIERIWSGVKMSYRSTQRDVTQVDAEQLRAEMDHPTHRIRSDYVAMLSLWEAAFGKDFRIFLYDDLVADPRAFLYAVEDFLSLEHFVDEKALSALSNVDSKKLSMPTPVRELLCERYLPQIVALECWVPGIAARWSFEG